MSYPQKVTKTLIKDAGVVCEEVEDDKNSPYFGLVSEDLSQIRPNYEAMIISGQLKITDQRSMNYCKIYVTDIACSMFYAHTIPSSQVLSAQ